MKLMTKEILKKLPDLGSTSQQKFSEIKEKCRILMFKAIKGSFSVTVLSFPVSPPLGPIKGTG